MKMKNIYKNAIASIGLVLFGTFITFLIINSYKVVKKMDERVAALNFTRDSIERVDIFHLASIINAECMTCVDSEKYMIGSVILNRAEFKRKPILEIIKEKNQFKGYLTSNYIFDSTSLAIANDLVKGINRDSSVYYFFSANSSPCWSSNMVIVQKDKFYHKFAY